MKQFMCITLWLINLSYVAAQDTNYYSLLRTSLSAADKEYTFEKYQELANCCERILYTNPDNWLYHYYMSYACIFMGFIETDSDRKDILFDKAQTIIDSLFLLKPKESEIYVLLALLYFGRMEINSMVRGPKYLPLAYSALDEAEILNPDNPRIYFLRGKSTMYTPKFMGGGKEAAIPLFEKALKLYQQSDRSDNMLPYWGKGSSEYYYKECLASND